ncbi:MAG: hypothetical protein K1X68_08685 [Saprospiraceae bacterium]|nr:hypothetical protein [Saprospiraceae bacterium]HMW38400.1 hypothetical protein [Saprospiraceae bacterium]HMX87296.1 hypothetical protein [Saprospiraceae bacterium]HMZ39123.1 hypothetical protein [Saprospiraceae bacterium]HNA63296.1 hypothetical protein [Saprospiraceae bacterium]
MKSFSLILKPILILILLLVMNFNYTEYFFENDLQKYSSNINLIRKVIDQHCEVVYFGESSNNTFHQDDIDQRSISEMLTDYYPYKLTGHVTMEASHAGIYYEYIRQIPAQSNIQTVIVTMNLRSFDASWIYSNLETALQKSIVLLKDRPPLYSRFLLSFKGYDIKTDKEREQQYRKKWKNDILYFPYPVQYKNVTEWERVIASRGIKNEVSQRDSALTLLARHYIKTYAFQIDTLHNPRISDFDRIVLLAKERGWHLVFNLMSENTDKAEKLVGHDLTYLMRSNQQLLIERYRRMGVMVIDNLDAVRDEDYIDQNWTTEHYAERGRRTIAKNLAIGLREIYPTDYRDPEVFAHSRIRFYNDLEGGVSWRPIESITDVRSFSGKKSSACGSGQEYSATFLYPVQNLPDPLSHLELNVQLFQETMEPKANLVIELIGKKIKNNYTGIPLTSISQVTNAWTSVHHSYTLPADFNQYELIKIYFYNPGSSRIYVDDIGIEFKFK